MDFLNKNQKPCNPSLAEDKIPDYDYLFQSEEGKNGKKKKSFFSKLIKLNLLPLILSTIVYIFQTAPVWAIPICSANIINLATEAIETGSISAEIWKRLIINGVVLAVLIIQNVPSTILRWRISSNMLRKTSAGIKCAVIRKLQSLSITYHKDMQTGKIQSKFLKDTDSVDSLFHILIFNVIPNVINVLGAIVISVYRSPLMSLFFLLVIPCNVALTYAFRKTIKKRNREYRLRTENMSTQLSTMLEMIPITKAHGLEEKEIQTVESTITQLSASGKKMDRTIAKFGSSTYVVNQLLSALCLAVCAVLAIKKVIGVGDIVLYQSMFASISGGVSNLIGIAPTLSSGFEALDSVSEIMEENNVELNIGKKIIPAISGEIAFQKVSYKYPNTEEYVVKELDLSVRAGECIAVVGASGSGKSTLMNLIIGLLTPTEGEILIDGTPLTDLHLSEYRHHLSVVSQNNILFSGSIRDNITYGLDCYSEEDLQAVVDMANLQEFVKDLPEGLDTPVGEHGDKLSGGQKQRITIARALIRNPKILILDEATSALDNISEYHVQQAIAKSIQGRTTFIVAHRLSTIRDADRIVVMEEGRAVEIGAYEELMERKGKFFALKQMNERNVQIAQEALQ